MSERPSFTLTPLFGDTAETVSASNQSDNNKTKNDNDGRDKLYPISFRVTADEKAHLKKAAGKASVSAYVRQSVLGDLAQARPAKYERKQKELSLDTVELARLLGMFGQSELATAILALSLAATQGNIDVTPELEEKIECACDDIQTIKQALILSLGVKPQGTGCP